VTHESLPALMRAGANGVAVISAIWESSHAGERVRALMALLAKCARPLP
jgi:thiamine monophosphate synthase